MQKDTYLTHRSIAQTIVNRQQQSSSNLINNRVEALKVLSNSLLLELEGLRIQEDTSQMEKIDFAAEVERFQVDLIRTALLRTGGRQRAAARLLNVKATTLHAKIKRYGLEANVVGIIDI